MDAGSIQAISVPIEEVSYACTMYPFQDVNHKPWLLREKELLRNWRIVSQNPWLLEVLRNWRIVSVEIISSFSMGLPRLKHTVAMSWCLWSWRYQLLTSWLYSGLTQPITDLVLGWLLDAGLYMSNAWNLFWLCWHCVTDGTMQCTCTNNPRDGTEPDCGAVIVAPGSTAYHRCDRHWCMRIRPGSIPKPVVHFAD